MSLHTLRKLMYEIDFLENRRKRETYKRAKKNINLSFGS